MATNKSTSPNIDNSNLSDYPFGRVRDDDGSGNGTPVNRFIYSDIHEFFGKLMRLAGLGYNSLPDNETNGYQLIEALKLLGNKNNELNVLSSSGGVLLVPLKLSVMRVKEFALVKSNFDLDSETIIKDSNLTTVGYSFNYLPSERKFKNGDYVLIVKTDSGFDLIRQADSMNLDVLVNELLYLKAATEAEEYLAESQTKATTPYTNSLAFARRVIGLDSALFLATQLRNGLMSKEDKTKLDNFESKVLNIGFVSGIDIDTGTIGSSYTVGGNVVSATLTAKSGNANSIRVVLANTMTNTNYYVRSFVQAASSNIFNDNSIGALVFKPINATTFDFSIQEFNSQTQNLKIHFEVVKI